MKPAHLSLEDSTVVEQLGVLTREREVRLLNCSISGCLLETASRIDVGAIASIRVTLDGRELVDDVQIVRCQPIAGAGDRYHVGAQFLWTQPLHERCLRGALRRAGTGSSGDSGVF
jgi:hypothetical protein